MTKITLLMNKNGNKSRLTFFHINGKNLIPFILFSGCVYANKKPDTKKNRGI